MSIYDFKVMTQDGREVSLADYRGKVLLIVNTATECGFTPHYEPLQALYEAHQAEGLEILDFPCNQYGAQAPGSNEEIRAFCTSRFGVTFPQFAKVDVMGENAIPLYRYLTENTAFKGFGDTELGRTMDGIMKSMNPDYEAGNNVKWNFTKFVIDREGHIAARFEPTENMADIAARVKELL